MAIVGKPNVGKSTLLNSFLGVKVAPTSSRPQTTRQHVRGIYSTEDRQAVFVDTPGLHKSRDALGNFMNQDVHSTLSDADGVIWVVDLRTPPSEEDEAVARAIRDRPGPMWLVGNKLDVAKYPEEAIRLYIDLLRERPNTPVVSLSAQNDPKAVQALLAQVLATLPENPFYFPTDSRSDQSREHWAAEIIREEAMKTLREEIPYSVAVRVTEWETKEPTKPKHPKPEVPGHRRPQRRDNDNETPTLMDVITADLIVERTQHRQIAIGAGGRMLKEIGQRARKQLEVFLGHRVYLDLNVEVIKNWRSDEEALRELGYEQ
ncbi:MAG TPA: GTPase Era [Deinococcales bacterium]|nr:GTPase Era [Deinococcales bacterium]